MRAGVLLLVLCVLASCGGQDETEPAAETVSVPKELQFPSALLIEVDELQPAPPKGEFAALVGMGPLTDEILAGVENMDAVNEDIGSLFNLLNLLEIPSDPNLKQMSASLTLDLTPDIAIDEEVTLSFDLDFGDFDLDRDGKTEGCADSTCPVDGAAGACPSEAPASKLRPICLRIWENSERLLAGTIRASPSGIGAGAGRFRMSARKIFSKGGGNVLDNFSIDVRYDHTDPTNKTAEVLRGIRAGPGLDAPLLASLHLVVGASVSEAGVQKTINMDGRVLAFSEEGSAQYLGRFIDGQPYMGLHIQATGSQAEEIQTLSPPVCVDMDAADLTDPGRCAELGIDVGGNPFVGPVNPLDLRLPPLDDFPLFPEAVCGDSICEVLSGELETCPLDCASETVCYNGSDDDRDGLFDCADPDCVAEGDCAIEANHCFDQIDNDEDGLIDCDDLDDCYCYESVCDDGVDNDDDGLIDCDDPHCAPHPVCFEPPDQCVLHTDCGLECFRCDGGQCGMAADLCGACDGGYEVCLCLVETRAGQVCQSGFSCPHIDMGGVNSVNCTEAGQAACDAVELESGSGTPLTCTDQGDGLSCCVP